MMGSGTLFAKLTAAFLTLLLLLGTALLGLSYVISNKYSLEVMQRLNQSVAMYIADQHPLIKNGIADEAALDSLATRAMVLNPSLEIYILNKHGRIISHRLPAHSVKMNRVDLAPIEAFLQRKQPMPLFGDDPRNPLEPNIISVSPIVDDNQTQGYVYTVVGGQMYQNLKESAFGSYVIRIGAMLTLGATLSAGVLGCIAFFVLTRRLTRLRHQVSDFDLSGSSPPPTPSPGAQKGKDEIDQLERSFVGLAAQIHQQFDSLRELDQTRRELIANVSHDLRTPLASMQGYLETLLLKQDSLTEQQKSAYLEIAFKNSQNLNQLIGELFELASLEATTREPEAEPFSLMELAHDCAQEFGLKAEEKNIAIKVASTEDCFVCADIALIHRVLQNLIENALKHTPENGQITLALSCAQTQVTLKISDTGNGIKQEELPYIFERYYQSRPTSVKNGSGLGLAIVKRILELHQSDIEVESLRGRGSAFSFALPAYIQNSPMLPDS